jgi:hypothetical protein
LVCAKWIGQVSIGFDACLRTGSGFYRYSRLWVRPTRVRMEAPTERNRITTVNHEEDRESIRNNSCPGSLGNGLLIDEVLFAVDRRDARDRAVL